MMQVRRFAKFVSLFVAAVVIAACSSMSGKSAAPDVAAIGKKGDPVQAGDHKGKVLLRAADNALVKFSLGGGRSASFNMPVNAKGMPDKAGWGCMQCKLNSVAACAKPACPGEKPGLACRKAVNECAAKACASSCSGPAAARFSYQ